MCCRHGRRMKRSRSRSHSPTWTCCWKSPRLNQPYGHQRLSSRTCIGLQVEIRFAATIGTVRNRKRDTRPCVWSFVATWIMRLSLMQLARRPWSSNSSLTLTTIRRVTCPSLSEAVDQATKTETAESRCRKTRGQRLRIPSMSQNEPAASVLGLSGRGWMRASLLLGWGICCCKGWGARDIT